MSIPTRAATRRWASAIALATLLVLLVAPVHAAGPITMKVRGLLGGRFEAGQWAAVAVSLANDGPPVAGTLVADSEAGPVRRAVELPGGARKEVVLYLRPAAFTRQLGVRFESGAAPVSATAELRALDGSGVTVAVVGDGAGALRAQLAARDAAGPIAPFDVPATDLPERPEPLRGVEVIVWAGDSSGLTAGQRQTIERWVAAGGQLLVVGGPDWQARTDAFSALLPLRGLAAVDGASTAGLVSLAGALPLGTTTLTVATGSPVDGARTLVALGPSDPRPLIASIARGAGRVTWIAADLAAPAFTGWAAGGAIWGRLVSGDPLNAFFGGGKRPEDMATSMAQALANLPALAVPPAELLLALIVGYILLIGPVSYLLLRRFDRRDLAWVTAPILVLVFSACSYGIGTSLKGSQIIVNQITVLSTVADGTVASASTWAGIFSPARATYDLSVPGNALLAAVSTTGDPAGVAQATEQGDPAHLRGLAVNVFGMKAIRAETLVPYQPSLSVTWQYVGGRLRGTVTNLTDAPVEDVAVLTSSSGEMIGTLAARASQDFQMAATDFTGTSPADQVYGFTPGDASTDAGRTREVRRQVLSAIVGYGAPVPISVVSGGADRGPFVVGWHDGGPIDVTVDGEQVQRYSRSVEVLSGRPSVDPTDVTLTPIDLVTRVITTEGDVNHSDPLTLLIGKGSATFEIAAPLELAGIVPDGVAILVGSDPGSVMLDQVGNGAFLPPGYTVELQDAVDGSWSLLGSPDLTNRFTVTNVGRAVRPGGMIHVRVIGEHVNPQQGAFSVFVSARLHGALR